MRLLQVIFHDRLYFARGNRVQVENIGYRDTNRFVVIRRLVI